MNRTKNGEPTNPNNVLSNYSSSDLDVFGIGVSEISFELNARLTSFIISKIQTKLQSPKRIIDNVKFDRSIKNRNLLAKSALYAILQSLSLDDVWASRMGIAMTPFANFSHALLSETLGKDIADQLLSILKGLDPISNFMVKQQVSARAIQSDEGQVQIVDTDFIEIDTDTIYARQFIGSQGTSLDINAALAKTEIAEKLHQEMLRDIASFLQGQKIIPYESDSVDLMFESNSQTRIVEIKSTNDINLFAQCSKGAFQLAYYVEALSDNYANLKSALVIHITNNEEQKSICSDVLKRLNTTCLIYDPTKDWPNRLPGLLSF